MTLGYGGADRIAIMGALGRRLAEIVDIGGPVIDRQVQVMRRNRGPHRRPQCLDARHRGATAHVLQHHAQAREAAVQPFQLRQEALFGIHDADIEGIVGRHLTVDQQHHIRRLHRGEDRIVDTQIFDPALGVGRNPLGVALDPDHTRLLGHRYLLR